MLDRTYHHHFLAGAAACLEFLQGNRSGGDLGSQGDDGWDGFGRRRRAHDTVPFEVEGREALLAAEVLHCAGFVHRGNDHIFWVIDDPGRGRGPRKLNTSH